MKGKEKCKALKEIRKQIAENNNIEYVVSECKHKGECKGTCPKCEAEVRYLEKELEKRRSLGQKVAIAGVSMGIAASMSACSAASVVGASAAGAPATVVYTITHPAVVEPEPLGGEAVPAYPINDPGYDVMGDVEYIPPVDEDISGDEDYSPDYYDENNDESLEPLAGEIVPYDLEGAAELPECIDETEDNLDTDDISNIEK